MTRIFSVLDLQHGYHQMPLLKRSQDAPAMPSPLRLIPWKVMPMGVKNGNPQFQCMTEELFRHLDCADPFVHNIIASGRTPQMTEVGR